MRSSAKKAPPTGAPITAKVPKPKMGDLLFEIGCEEIPAGMIPKAAEELKSLLKAQVASNGLVGAPTFESTLEVFGAPRRLTAIVKNILLCQEDVTREEKGPPKSIAYDAMGEPTRAAFSFAERQGVPVSSLVLIDGPKGPVVAVRKVVAGESASKILERVLPEVIREISWPRSMYWTGLRGARFIRPIRWIVALFDGKVVPCTYAEVKAGHRSDGHRFLGKRSIPLSGPKDYEPKLKASCVLCRPETRRKKIESEIQSITSRKGLKAHEDPGLLDLVTYLNEYPTVIMGSFDEKYLGLPEEILITVMRDHQKYFALESRRGQLAPHFLAVINLPRDPKGLVQAGHERVLRARFADAQFFWDTDQKTKLGDYLPRLKAVTYESRLGSYHDKVERMRSIARWLAEQLFSSGIKEADVAGCDRAGELAKCDLVTGMVGEFSELQGIVGGLYAHAQGEVDEIADAVYDHYRPQGLEEEIPRNLTGCVVSFADKLDSIMACFAVGAIPTGSSDPFALRRAALGIVKMVLERSLPLSISAAVSAAAKTLREQPPRIAASEEVQKQVLDFILDRAKFILRERRGFAYDEINAVFASGADDLVDAVERATAVRAIRNTRNFPPLAASFKRIRNILEKSVGSQDKSYGGVRQDLLKDDFERQLHTAAQRIGEEAGRRRREKKYKAALEKISELRPAVDMFFDKVHVMAEDPEVRKNRIALLGGLLREFSTIADFSELGGEEVKEGRDVRV
ncbi:MAG TPA: glycine--tRNA ligase subunit beta [Candidatus Acidoferrales bacterium]|nr:glycine--tRNA ligase subunit beta [Candidatus Acidoferrales bacterium]